MPPSMAKSHRKAAGDTWVMKIWAMYPPIVNFVAAISVTSFSSIIVIGAACELAAIVAMP